MTLRQLQHAGLMRLETQINLKLKKEKQNKSLKAVSFKQCKWFAKHGCVFEKELRSNIHEPCLILH